MSNAKTSWRERHGMTILTAGICALFGLVIVIQVGC